MSDLSLWLKDLLPRTPGLHRGVATRELRLAMREFFMQSFCWRETLDPVAAVAAQEQYTATPSDPTNTEVFDIKGVEYVGVPLRVTTERPPGTLPTGTPTWFYVLPPNAFKIWPVPSETVADALRVRVVLMPTITATTVPDWVFQRFYDALLDGALGRLYAHPAKAYSNMVGAQYHLNRFRDAIGQASADAKTGFANAQNWCYPRFGK